MRLSSFFFALTLIHCAGLAIEQGFNQSAIAQTADQIRRLKKAGVPVIMPTYIPRGFRLTQFESHLSHYFEPRVGRTFGNSFDATYKGPNSCSFSLGGGDSGWGAPEPIRRWVVNSKLLGRVTFEEMASMDGSHNYLTAITIPDYVEGSVIPGSGPLASKGFPYAGYTFSFDCINRSFSRSEATKILQSLQIKNP